MTSTETPEPSKKVPKPPHVRVMGGPYGQPHRIPAPNKRGWSLVQKKWRMHGYTKATLPPVMWCGATRYNLVWVDTVPYYVYDPQPKILARLRDHLPPPGGRSASLVER